MNDDKYDPKRIGFRKHRNTGYHLDLTLTCDNVEVDEECWGNCLATYNDSVCIPSCEGRVTQPKRRCNSCQEGDYEDNLWRLYDKSRGPFEPFGSGTSFGGTHMR